MQLDYAKLRKLGKIAKYSFRRSGEEVSSDEKPEPIKKPVKEEEPKDEEEEQLILRLTTGSFSKLPLELIFDILSRLPIKTLSQSCKWVSKSWFKIIHYHRFARIHHSKASTIFSPCIAYFNLRFKAFYLVDHQVFDSHSTSCTVHHPEFSGFGWAFDVVDACNGLICMAPDHECYKPQPYYIFNPITKSSINLPNSPKYKIAPRLSAFGYDPITNEHKIVRIMKSHEVEIYTIGSGPDGWRTLPNIPTQYCYISVGTAFVNGACHWTVIEKEQGNYAILALDMSTEKYQEIPPPPCVAPSNAERITKRVGVLGGCLCFGDQDFEDHTDVWVLKPKGVKYAWSKDYVVRKSSIPFGVWNDGYPVVKLGNGDLLLKHWRKDGKYPYEKDVLHYYNPERKMFKRIATHGIPDDACSFGNFACLVPIVFVGNLISPKNLGTSTESYCKKGNSLEAPLLQSLDVSVDSIQLSKSDSEVFADSRSVKYISNYVYEGHDQTVTVLEKLADEIQKLC